ncbi:MAG: hypothetical protein R3Y63_08975 [Eubacteriales bacterium]
MFIALKPIHFDKWYQVNEMIPDGVIAPKQVKRLLASGRVALVNAEATPLSSPEPKGVNPLLLDLFEKLLLEKGEDELLVLFEKLLMEEESVVETQEEIPPEETQMEIPEEATEKEQVELPVEEKPDQIEKTSENEEPLLVEEKAVKKGSVKKTSTKTSKT